MQLQYNIISRIRFPRIVPGTDVTLFYTLRYNIKYNSVRVSQTFRLVFNV